MTRFGGLNKLVIPILAIFLFSFSFLSIQSLASAEIKVSPPSNWQPSPNNNSTVMTWFENSTKSVFGISKSPPSNSSVQLFMAAGFLALILNETGALISADQISFGNSNIGYRYIVNLPSYLNDTVLLNLYGVSFYKDMQVPLQAMLILTQKQNDIYAIILYSPRETFGSVLKEIKPTIDSIQVSNSTSLAN